MRMKVRRGTMKLWFPMPLTILLNDLTALFLPKVMAHGGVTMTKKQARKLVRATRKCLRRHRGLTLVEAESATGDWVEIKL